MNPILYMLFACALVGLFGERLGKRANIAMWLAILAYVIYAYRGY